MIMMILQKQQQQRQSVHLWLMVIEEVSFVAVVGVLRLLQKSKLIRLGWWRLVFEWVWVCWAKRTFVCPLLRQHGRWGSCVC